MPIPTVPHSKRVVLISYDMPSAEHQGIRQFFRGYGEEGRAWVSIQASTRLLLTLDTPEGIRKEIEHWADGQTFIVDVTHSDFSGMGKKAVWEWLDKARSECKAIERLRARARLESGRQRQGELIAKRYGYDSKQYEDWIARDEEISSLDRLLDDEGKA